MCSYAHLLPSHLSPSIWVTNVRFCFTYPQSLRPFSSFFIPYFLLSSKTSQPKVGSHSVCYLFCLFVQQDSTNVRVDWAEPRNNLNLRRIQIIIILETPSGTVCYCSYILKTLSSRRECSTIWYFKNIYYRSFTHPEITLILF